MYRMSLIATLLLLLLGLGPATAQQAPPPAGDQPVNLLPEASQSEVWRQIRAGQQGRVAGVDPWAGTLIQSEGESWRTVRNGPYKLYAGWTLLGMIGLIGLFFALRGRIRIDHGWSGELIERFNGLDRFAHWLTASTFIILALTGLNLMFGRYLLLPLIGPAAFGAITYWGKLAHNYLAFGFIVGFLLMFILWIRDNLPSRHDVVWLARGGGLLGGGHPPARKFNAGQKLIFWAVVLGGISLTLSGLQLMFPFQFRFFDGTFQTINAWFGTSLPAVSPMGEQQLAAIWHGAVGVVLTAIIIGHIYIGSLGMEGAFAAMGSGKVDRNWAEEHHSLWVREVEARRRAEAEVVAARQPAE